MVSLYESGIYLINGTEIVPKAGSGKVKTLTGMGADKAAARKGTIAYSILETHNISDNMKHLKLRLDSVASHDIMLVDIAQIAETSDMGQFPIPYVLTNCHSILCVVSGTINEDDHMFGLSAAREYGGVYVSSHIVVIHQYVRGMMAGCSRMILGSDSHTRCGTLGTMAVGEGGSELVKQFLRNTYDVARPGVVAVYLGGASRPGTGPQDIALAIIGAVFRSGYVENKVVEFVGPGIAPMTTDYRSGVDVVTTETTCLSSTWKTDEDAKRYLVMHNGTKDYKELSPTDVAYYDGCVYVDLSMVKPMVALPFHPGNTYEIDQPKADTAGILREVETEAVRISGDEAEFTLLDEVVGGQFLVQQAVIAGYADGAYSNVIEVARVLRGKNCGCDGSPLTVYPPSQPVFADLARKGAVSDLMDAGAIIRTALYEPRFDTGDTPCNNGLSIRHTTRNFPGREGSKPGNDQMAAVALMDACSATATTANGGILTFAWEMGCWGNVPEYGPSDISYKNCVYMGYGKGNMKKGPIYGPNIKGWSQTNPLTGSTLLKTCSEIMDPITTTGELIPSGGTSSYRSNPLGLAESTLPERDPEYAGRTKEVDRLEKVRVEEDPEKELELEPKLGIVFQLISRIERNEHVTMKDTEIGSMTYATKPDDGSAREQAASRQRVIGGLANICKEYVTKRYRSNVMNWGMVPFQMEADPEFGVGDYIYMPSTKAVLGGGMKRIKAYMLGSGEEDAPIKVLDLYIADMIAEERKTVKAGCLINYNRTRH